MSKSASLLYRWATFVQENAVYVLASLTIGILLLCLVAIKAEKIDADLLNWVQRSPRIEAELDFIVKQLSSSGSTGQLLLQTPKNSMEDILTVDAFMVHLEAMAIATHVTVDLYDVSWSLKDICFTPTLPDFEGPNVNMMLDNMMPCVIKTPLDCFWEGAKLLGPEQPIRVSSMAPSLKWTSLNPIFMIEAERQNHPHASVPYDSLLDWMSRVGIKSGYQYKPCLDPSDPNCPITAPNKAGRPPDIGVQLSGGCHGLATKQMHWHEDEIVGGITRNESGYITSAKGLQSTIQLMGEKDMYELWRKTSKVQDISNWSIDKAKLILDMWQHRFKQELSHFTRTSITTSSYKIHAMTSDSMLQPIDIQSLRDPTIFLICFTLLTIMSYFTYPSLKPHPRRKKLNLDEKKAQCTSSDYDSDEEQEDTKKPEPETTTNTCPHERGVEAMKRMILATITSIYIGLIFIASLGLSLMMDLPMNVATTQLLPPIALYYGFNLFNAIVCIYSDKFGRVPRHNLTLVCLEEFLPVVMIQTASYVIAFTAASITPVPATRVLVLQAIIHVLLTSIGAILIMPPLMTVYLRSRSSNEPCAKVFTVEKDIENGGGKLSFEDHIFSRIQHDLKNIRADNQQRADLSFSAQLEVNGIRTSFKLSAPIVERKRTNHPYPGYVKWDKENPIYHDVDSPNYPDYDGYPYPGSGAIYDKSFFGQLTSNKRLQTTVILLFAVIFFVMMSFAPRIKYGMSVKDIVPQNTPEHASWSVQEKYFPVYNVFAITRGNFDYPNNQRLLHEFYRSIEQVDGVISTESKFWLVMFRDWLLELQQKFDIDRNRSAISSEGWEANADDASKLAYKLLAQTGRADNPVDKGLVETNRLVDSDNIINTKAFYHYLSAWIAHDPFSYATSEANFEPEPKAIAGNPNDLRMDKAKPLISAHIPFLVKLASSHDNLKTIVEIRRISQAYEQLNLPNFPTGIPFIFWDQFINLDLLSSISLSIGTLTMFLVVSLFTKDLKLAAIITLPSAMTVLELYGFLGYANIPFNNVINVLVLSTLAISTVQTIHPVVHFGAINGDDIVVRSKNAIKGRLRVTMINILLLFISNVVSHIARVDFINRCASLFLCLSILTLLNSVLLAPVLLSWFGSNYKITSQPENDKTNFDSEKTTINIKTHTKKGQQQIVKTKRNYPRMQSEISLSTISEEPQLESVIQDLKVDLNIKCYQ